MGGRQPAGCNNASKGTTNWETPGAQQGRQKAQVWEKGQRAGAQGSGATPAVSQGRIVKGYNKR